MLIQKILSIAVPYLVLSYDGWFRKNIASLILWYAITGALYGVYLLWLFEAFK